MDSVMTERIISGCQAEVERNKQKSPPPSDFPILRIPVGRYTDEEFLTLEQRHLFGRSWLYAGFASELPTAGSFKLCEHLRRPIVLVRGDDGEIRAFYNVCRHRGAPLVNEPCGRNRMLVCQFHSWTYALNGELKHIPSGHEFPGVEKEDMGLVSVRCERWGNMIFINEDPGASPLLESLGPLSVDFADKHMDTRKAFTTRTIELPCNWKIALEGNVETYHLPRVHPNTVNTYIDHRGTFIQLYPQGHSAMYNILKTGQEAEAHNPLGFEGGNEQRINRETIPNFTIFPNMIASTAENEFVFITYWPVDAATCRLDIIYTGPDGHDDPAAPAAQQLMAIIDVTLDEDYSNMEWIQKSFASNVNGFLRAGYQERRVYHLHESIDRCIPDVPERYRVTPVLEPYETDPYATPIPL